MLIIQTLEDIAALQESSDIECKKATGKDGKGELPKDFWESYSAFANAYGGDVFLGIREDKDRHFHLQGIENTQKVLDDLWTSLNNSEKVSANILREENVAVIDIDGHSIIHIHVPRAPRTARPVYLNGSPLKKTYKRLNTSDVLVSEIDVKRMLAEQTNDSRDNEVLKGLDIDDFSIESIQSYRNIYASQNPDHPWNQLDQIDFLKNIGVYRKDRDTGIQGFTRAGLLMFGKFTVIQEFYPNYMLDYQERPEAKAEARWVDRVTLDGTWAGNLFEFYQKIIRKLTSDLKIPFVLEGDKRKDETVVHTALREALVNTLVHADYTNRASVLVVRRPDMFGFRNPGLMRVPKEIAIQGGESDCRNRLVHQMFRYIGLGEQAGSGLPKIYEGWREQHWRKPVLAEKEQPSEQTLLKMHMLSLIPEHIFEELNALFGKVFTDLPLEGRLVVVTACIERTVDHSRMMQIMNIHPRDLSRIFSDLTEKGVLKQDGAGRGTVYFLPGARADDMLMEILGPNIDAEIPETSGVEALTSGGLDLNSGGIEHLRELAQAISEKKRVPKESMERGIINLCAKQALTLEELSDLLNRSGDFLRKDYLQPLIKEKRIKLLYPTMPNHPKQAYTA